MTALKPISREAVPVALTKAERYRFLNEPREAESICLDILEIDPRNQPARVTLLLALTDQFEASSGVGLDNVRRVLGQLAGEYDRAYYGGIIFERWGKAQFARGMLPHVVRDWLHQAMACYENAEAVRPPGNDDSILRWNACARMIERDLDTEDELDQQPVESGLDDEEVPTL